jgi:hypothetical protein
MVEPNNTTQIVNYLLAVHDQLTDYTTDLQALVRKDSNSLLGIFYNEHNSLTAIQNKKEVYAICNQVVEEESLE